MNQPATSSDTRLSSWVTTEFGVELRTVSSPVGLGIGDLVGLALRRNPRRAHLLVSTVLGKHIPVDPDLIVATGRLLGELAAGCLAARDSASTHPQWADLAQAAVRGGHVRPLLHTLDAALATRPVTAVGVLGFAETATSLGHLVADQLHADRYLHSTRRAVPGVSVAGTFEEGHSHATSHLLLPIPNTLLDDERPLILVDDELSTGRTAMGTIIEMHGRSPRSHYVLASLIDLRSDNNVADMDALATRLGCRIDVVALARGEVRLPDDLTRTVVHRLASMPAVVADVPDGPAQRVDVPTPTIADPAEITWPAAVPDGGRHGFLESDGGSFDQAVAAVAGSLRTLVDERLGGRGGRVLVVGTEELMYLPLRVAQHLGEDDRLSVTFQSTTRSPVFALDDPGYPIRRQFAFPDPEGEVGVGRYLYNAYGDAEGGIVEPDLTLVLADAAADTAILRGLSGPVAVLRAAGQVAELVVLGAVDPGSVETSRLPLPRPLTGPDFSSYAADEVQWLLTDLSDRDLEGDVADREAAIQAGTAHYAESLPVEFQPDERYQELFASVLQNSAERLALAVGLVTELVLSERGDDIILASLARAGTPIGILMRRWANFSRGLTLPHYALSIVRGRGIDAVALRYLVAHHEPRNVVFVDGWTGKGAITVELSAALKQFSDQHGVQFNDDLAVLADPGYCVRTFGTRDDFLIASACLNSTVSGLISRTVLNDAYLAPGQFHGAKFYRELAPGDVSSVLLDTVTAAFPAVREAVLGGLPGLAESDREPTFAGWTAIEAIRAEFGIESVNFVKPGVGETTRVLLRRVPWRILVREADNPDHEHLRLLAAQRDVPVDVRPDLPYSCVGLIRRMSATEPGEG